MNNNTILLSIDELKEFLHIATNKTIWRYVEQGKLPKPKLTISKNNRLWDKAEVLNHLTKNNQG